MSDFDDPYGLKAYNQKKRAENEADAAARVLRLQADTIETWRQIMSLARPMIRSSRRPCDYHPWSNVLKELCEKPRFVGKLPPDMPYPDMALQHLAEDIAQPGWPEPRRDLIEFALTYLEADVMLFRSGYAKRHLIKRLQQSPLTDGDVSRIRVLLERAVTDGTGLEEARAYRKLAAHLVVADRLPGFDEWLAERAEGAILTWDRAAGPMWLDILASPNLTEKDISRLQKVNWFGPSDWGIVYPALREVVKAGKRLTEPGQHRARTAYYMLMAIKRVCATNP